jgi:hypothetical protein
MPVTKEHLHQPGEHGSYDGTIVLRAAIAGDDLGRPKSLRFGIPIRQRPSARFVRAGLAEV